MTRRLAQLVAGLAALAIVLAAVVGIPTALVVYVGWPLPTAWPTVDQARQFLQAGVSDTTIIKLLAFIVWVSWAQLTMALMVETVALVRRRAVQTLRLLPGLQPLAARLVATIALVATALGPHRDVAAPPLAQIVAAAPAVLPDAIPASEPVGETEVGSRTEQATTEVMTRDRDTWWRIAESHAGDGLRWREIRDLNIGRQVSPGVTIDADTDHVEPGWKIRVPTDGSAPTPAADDEADATEAAEWQVEPGDHFWAIATQTLEAHWDRTPTDTEIALYWRQLVEANRDRLLPPGDPDLIYPDQRFTLPHLPADPTAPRQPEAPTGDDDGRPKPPPETDDPRGGPRRETTDTTPKGEPSPETPAGGWEAALSGDGQQPVEPPDGSGDVEEEPRTAFGIPAGLTGSAAASSLLAAGVVATIRWRRRRALQQRPIGYRLPTPLPEATDEVNRLAAAAPPDRVLDDLATLLGTIPPGTQAVLVTTTDDGTVTLLFDDDSEILDPPSPWALTDDVGGPVGWTARLGDRGPDRSIGLPLLVTLGGTDGTSVLANVTAMPTLVVHGPDGLVRERLRTMALEVATSRVAIPLDVVIAGDDRLASLEQVRHSDNFGREIERAVDEVARGIIPDDRVPRLLVSHGDGGAPEVPSEVIGTVAVITANHTERSRGWTLEVQDRRTGQLHLPDGAVVELELPYIDPEAIDAELDRLNQPPVPPPQHPAKQDEANTNVDPATNGHPTQQITVIEPPFCEVRLLGPVEVVRDGERVEGFTRRPLEVLAYLVTHRQGTTTGRIDVAIWPDHARPGSQRIGSALTRIRRLIGNGPDGQPLLPPRTGDEPIPLSDHVGCDLDRALEHLTLADRGTGKTRAHHQQAALDLVRGQPFQDLLVDWSTDISQEATIRLQDAAVDLARACREDGDYDRAEHAIRQGHALLDGNGDLYLEHGRLELTRGHPERIPDIREKYRRSLTDSADEDTGVTTTPRTAIEAELRELTALASDG